MHDPVDRIDEIFWEAAQLAVAEERAAFLARVCGDNRKLSRRVEKLLQVQPKAAEFLERPYAGPARTGALPEVAETPRSVIGPYKLLEQIGEGGMGLVFVADQEHPVRRRVALKVVKPGMDTRQVLARFEAERQALALMDHPNIAKVLDAGVTESGRPYFVMELVRGVPITDYCDQARLTPRQRLELFLPVCRAIQHAHQKGIIHRDIKPSNLLVTLYDSHPVPKVIDFGIAKAVGSAFADHSVYTGFAQLVGTPMYMSPEQAEMTAQDVDTRADVYALGVVLYELLTGSTPFDGEALRQAGFDEMRRIIREDEPAKPSHRVTTMSAEKQSTVSGQRGVDGRQLSRQLQGGLDWVVMTCLEKDRTRRYESAGALAADIERFLRDEPVTACPPSTSYRLRTFTRRNRRALATVGVITAALVAATTVSVWQAVKARDAQNQAEAERDLATTAQRETAAAEERATTEAAIARAVSEFLQSDLLLQVNSLAPRSDEVVVAPNLTVKEALDRAAARIGNRFRDQPLVEAAIRTAIGNAYRSLRADQLAVGHLERAVTLRREQLGPDHPDSLASMDSLADAYSRVSQHLGAITLRQQIVASRTATLGPDHPDTLEGFGGLANAYMDAGQYDSSVPLWEQLLEKQHATRGAMHPATFAAMHTLALNYFLVDRFDESIALHKKVLEFRRSTLDPDDQSTTSCMITFARACQRAGKLDQADQLLREALKQFRNRQDYLWRQNQRANALGWLGRNLLLQEKYDEAEPILREAIAINQIEAPRRFYWMTLLGAVLVNQKKHAEAEPLLLQGFEEMKSVAVSLRADEKYMLVDAGESIVRFYEATNQPEKARAWRGKLPLMK